MPVQRCLYCYQSLPANAKDFHERCSRKFFGIPVPPELDYDSEQMQELAKQIIIRSMTVTGVQPKISLAIEKLIPTCVSLGAEEYSSLIVINAMYFPT
jgi:serine/threonine-protein kinase HipA